MYQEVIDFIKGLYPDKNPVLLHEPAFFGNEKRYLAECIDSTFVSYVGKFVTQFEDVTARYVGVNYAVAVVNGTAALQIALQVAGVGNGDEVITQPLTFVATSNAISHCGAVPVFTDVDLDTMGMSPEKLEDWLSRNCRYDANAHKSFNATTGRRISAIVPVHTFGFPCRIEDIVEIAARYDIPVVEDSAESIGSILNGKHTGTFGVAGILSYNGNKTITTGGGGMIITDDKSFAERAKHLTTTAKVPHPYEYVHDEIGYNYRLTNVNAAIGVAQMENLDKIIANKRETARLYSEFFKNRDPEFVSEPEGSKSNYWLGCVKFSGKDQKNSFLDETNSQGVMTRPVWKLMNELTMYKSCQTGDLNNAIWLQDRIANVPSGFRNESD